MNLSLDNLETIEQLVWTVNASRGEFALVIVRCNDAELRDRTIVSVCSQVEDLAVWVINPGTTALLEGIRDRVTAQTAAVMVMLLEYVENLEELLSCTNRIRDQFRSACLFPVVLWLTSEGLKQLKRSAPDFESWGTTIHLE